MFSHGAGLLLIVASSMQCAALTFGAAEGNTAIMRSMGILRLVRACEFFVLRPIWRMLLEVRALKNSEAVFAPTAILKLSSVPSLLTARSW